MESRYTSTTNDATDNSAVQQHVKHTKFDRCRFAKTCNGGDGIIFSTLFCSEESTSTTTLNDLTSLEYNKSESDWQFSKLYHSISRILLLIGLSLVLLLLFRLLNSTTDEFFSPGLELFSLHLGLPPRFAGVVSIVVVLALYY